MARDSRNRIDDPYALDDAAVLEPPRSFWKQLRYLGPGLILSASIVGSGELIATTKFGSDAGFVCLWVILLSCLLKVALQLEFGKHTIYSGETTMEALNGLPGPRLGKANWSIWTWLGLMPLKFLQVGGILGAVALLVHEVIPRVPVKAAVVGMALVVALLVFSGRYAILENISIGLIGLFTVLIFGALFKVIGLGESAPLDSDTAVSGANIMGGLTFNPAILKGAILGVAVGAFGITGVGGDEIMHYNYWLLEKGYAARTGPRDGSDGWTKRARGWIRIMYLDALLSMVVYTVMTVAFYLLGASILRANGGLGEGEDLLPSLTGIFTETFGEGTRWIFQAGAFLVLFSTLLAALAALSRTFADCFSVIGFFDFRNPRKRAKVIAILSFVIPTIWAIAYFQFEEPAMMIILGGIATSAMLLIVLFAGVFFHRHRVPESLAPGLVYRAAFWISAVVIAALSVVVVYRAVQKYQSKTGKTQAAITVVSESRIS